MRRTHADRRNATLYRDSDTDPVVAREIESVVALLRSLPDPEPESDLTARVMRKVAEIEAKPRVLRPVFGSSSGSRVAAALAAGIACAAVGIGLQETRVFPAGPARELAAAQPAAARSARPNRVLPVSQANRFAMNSAFPDARTAALFAGATPNPSFAVLPVEATPVPNLLDRHLDAQLNELQLNPQAFFERLERVQEPDRFVQRLAERAARRGDAAQVALNVRAVSHPLARPTVDRFLHASLVRQVSDR